VKIEIVMLAIIIPLKAGRSISGDLNGVFPLNDEG